MIPEPSTRRKPAAGLTPLIDVVFILLIFFMLVVQFSEYQQVPVSVTATTTAAVSEDSETRIITVTGAGQCRTLETSLVCAEAIAGLPDELANPVVIGLSDTAVLGDAIDLQSALIERGFEVSFGLRVADDAR